MSKRIMISSALKTTGTPGDFRLSLPPGIALDGKYKLAELYMCNSAYNVNSINNTLYWTESKGDKSTTVAAGYYTAPTLAIAIATALTAATDTGATFTGSYSTITGKMTFSTSPSAAITWQFDTKTTNSMGPLIGFAGGETGITTTGTNIANVNPRLNYRISVNATAAGEDTKGGSFTFLVPALGNLGSYFIWHPHPSYLQEAAIPRTTNVRIQVLDDDHLVIALLTEWYFVLEAC